MAIIGIGTDILHIPRFVKLISRKCRLEKMSKRILSKTDREYYQQLDENQRGPYLANVYENVSDPISY